MQLLSVLLRAPPPDEMAELPVSVQLFSVPKEAPPPEPPAAAPAAIAPAPPQPLEAKAADWLPHIVALLDEAETALAEGRTSLMQQQLQALDADDEEILDRQTGTLQVELDEWF